MRRLEIKISGMLLGAVLLAGCSASVMDPVSTAAVTPTEMGDNNSTPASASEQPPVAPVEAASHLVVAFTPPFPERTELFEPPKRAQSTVRRDDESGNTVELKGFINIAGPKAVLSIDGVITPIAVGDEKYGVQVISIEGPTVVLQRGRSRWTATLD